MGLQWTQSLHFCRLYGTYAQQVNFQTHVENCSFFALNILAQASFAHALKSPYRSSQQHVSPTQCWQFPQLFFVILLFLMPKKIKLPHLWIIFMCACICIYKYTHVRVRTMTWLQPKNTETFSFLAMTEYCITSVWSYCPLITGNSKS